jgi:hypothetical protein
LAGLRIFLGLENKTKMQCLVCGKIIEREKSWEHIRSEHVKPPDLTREKILQHAKKVAHPFELKTAYVTCVKVEENTIYLSLNSAELLIAFGGEHANIPWDEIVEWMILHEKGHLQCKDLYERPEVSAHVLASVEDYFIDKYLLPEKYYRVCKVNGKCSIAIRDISPLPYALRDGYYYTSLATFLAYGAGTLKDFNFLKPSEAKFVETISRLLGKIEKAEEIPTAAREIESVFKQLYPPKGVSWDNWQIANLKKGDNL